MYIYFSYFTYNTPLPSSTYVLEGVYCGSLMHGQMPGFNHIFIILAYKTAELDLEAELQTSDNENYSNSLMETLLGQTFYLPTTTGNIYS